MRLRSDGTISFQAYPDTKDSDFREPCLLYPIPGKEDRIFDQPFRAAYRHLELCLLEAKTIVIIGYSGRDPVIRAYLKEAASENCTVRERPIRLGQGEAGREGQNQKGNVEFSFPERHMIGFESDEAILQKLRERLRRMTDEELIKFGSDVRRLAENPFQRQLEEARREWKRRRNGNGSSSD